MRLSKEDLIHIASMGKWGVPFISQEFNKLCEFADLDAVQLLFNTGDENVTQVVKDIAGEGKPLFYACKSGNKKIVEFLLEQDVCASEDCAQEGLNGACAGGNLDLVKLLFLQFGDVVKNKAPAALASACISGDLEIVKYLFDHSSDTVKIENNASFALDNACFTGNLELVKYLFEKGGDSVIEKASYALKEACFSGNLELVKYLFEQDRDGCTTEAPDVLSDACEGGNLDLVKYLLDIVGDDAKEKVPDLLHYPCLKGNLQLVKHLFDIGGNVDRNKAAEMLPYACDSGNLDLVKFLFEQSGEAVKDKVASSLNSACNKGHLDVVKYLFEQVDDEVQSEAVLELRWPFVSGNLDLAKYLFEQGGDAVKDKAADGLWDACISGNLDLVKFLLEQGGEAVKAKAKSSYGFYETCNDDIARLLLNFIEVRGIPISKLIDPNSENLQQEVKSLKRNPLSYFESQTPKNHLFIEAFRLQDLQQEASKVELKKYEDDSESAMNRELLKQAEQHYNDVVLEEYQNQFDEKPGDSKQEKILCIEAKMRQTILEQIFKDSDNEFSTEARDFINTNRKALTEASDSGLMEELRENYLNSNTNPKHIAWRTLDKDAPVAYWENVLTQDFDDWSDQYMSQEGVVARERAAMYYLAVMDDDYPEQMADRITNWIGQLADIRRAHNFNPDEKDSPSCYPGTLGRIANMGLFHPKVQLPMGNLELAKDLFASILVESFTEALDKIKEDYEDDEDMQELMMFKLFEGLTELTADTVKEAIVDGKYDSEHIKQRMNFINKLCNEKYSKEGIDIIFTMLKHKGKPLELTEEEKIILRAHFMDIGQNSVRLGQVLSKYATKPLTEDQINEIMGEPNFNPYTDNYRKNLFNRAVRSALNFENDDDFAKKIIMLLIDKNLDFSKPEEKTFLQAVESAFSDEKLQKKAAELVKDTLILVNVSNGNQDPAQRYPSPPPSDTRPKDTMPSLKAMKERRSPELEPAHILSPRGPRSRG